MKYGGSGSKISGVEVWEMEVEGQQKQMVRPEISGQTQEEARFESGGRGKREDISQSRLMQQSDCQEEELLFSCFFFLWQNQRHN